MGFQIWQFFSYILLNKKNVTLIENRRKAILLKLRIVFSKNKLLNNLLKKGLLSLKNSRLFTISYKPVWRYDISNIVRYFKNTFSEICNYYSFAHNSCEIQLIYNQFRRFTAAMTIAHKIKSKVP